MAQEPEPYALNQSAAQRYLGVERHAAMQMMRRGDWPRHINLAPPGRPARRRYRVSDLEAFVRGRLINAESDRVNRDERAAVGL